MKLSPGLQKILNYAAKLSIENEGREVSREELAVELDMKNPRSLSNNFPKLKDAGVMTVTPNSVTVTALGMEMAKTEGLVSSAPQSNKEHQERLMDKYKLGGGEKKVLLALSDGQQATKAAIAEKLGMKIRSFSNLLTEPKKKGLLEKVGSDSFRLTDKMFLPKLGRPCDE